MHYLNDPKINSNDVQTLANSIIGTSILAMPFCFAKCGIILSIVLLIISTAITRACCNYLIKASIVTRRRNMELLGFYVFGSSGKALVEISVIGFLMGTCVAFFVVIGDLCPILVSKYFNIPNTSGLRLFMIMVTTFICIIPLSFQQSIKSLSFVCKASIAFYICLTLKTIVESFRTFHNDDHWSTNIELWNVSGVLQCIPIFSMAMSCQMQLFEVYENISSFDRIRQNIYHATSICLVVYTIIGFFGYVAFYNENLSGNILVNFRPSLSNDVITFGFILSIACSFPLVIFPCRSSLNSLLQKSKIHHHSEISPYVPESRYKPLTLFIIFSTMIAGILIPSVEVIIGFVGSTIGILICVLFPATCFIKIMQKNTGEKCIAQLMIIVGFIIMILGTYSNLMALDASKSGSHLATPEIIIPPAAPVANIDQLPHESIVKKNLSAGRISEDGIKKEELEMAVTAPPVVAENNNDVRLEMKVKDMEIKELKESKKKLEKEVQDIKQELVKQNKETQQLVLQKFDEIAEKVDKIQSMDNLKEDESGARKKDEGADDKKEDKSQDIKPNVESLKDDTKKTQENHKEIVEVVDTPIDNNKNNIDDKKEVKIEEAPKKAEEIKTKSEEPAVLNEDEKKPAAAVVVDEEKKPDEPSNQQAAAVVDPIVQHIVQNAQEPLSYQVGEKIMEEKKKNMTSIEKKVVEVGNKTNKINNEDLASHEDFKNEMRKKRNSEDFDLLLPSDPKDLQLKSILSIGRDLKAVDKEEV